VGLVLTAAAASVVLLASKWNETPASLGFRVVDEAGVPHPAPDVASAGRIEFSDGSRMTVAAEARASVTAIDAQGARVRLEHGRLSAHVVHLPKASWSIAAGPYQILVTGTAFDVSWTPETNALELWIRHGSVLVKGPNAGQGLAVFAGQRRERTNRPRRHGTHCLSGSAPCHHRADTRCHPRAITFASL
jgi:ferric-dicitrate binding protein FerR (iron transport regulator)